MRKFVEAEIRVSQVRKLLLRTLVGKTVIVSGYNAEIADVRFNGGEVWFPANWELCMEIKSYYVGTLSLESLTGGPALLQQCCTQVQQNHFSPNKKPARTLAGDRACAERN